ncbi:9-O-acetylesterase [Bacteroidia bacterium]|nr:9-O-acetylesterase [Bacteroidia bacterium]
MKRIFLFIFALSVITAHGSLKLPSLICDNMVLQQQSQTKLWGGSEPFNKISATCSWDNHTYSATCDKDGQWTMSIRTPQAGGPYSINFSTIRGGDKVAIKNVYIGEVWICSGQSNMAHPVKGHSQQPVDGSQQAIAESVNYPGIHIFKLPLTPADTPQEYCGGRWLTPSDKDAVANTAAVAWFYAVELYKKLNIPIGIIQSSWGSARIEAFMSPEAIAEAGGIDVETLKGLELVQKRPSLIYNGMIYPLHNYAARGFIWFQLPANRADYKNYPAALTSMIRSWRALWGEGDMPFINTQDALFSWDGSADKTTLPLIVEKQFDVRGKIPHYWIATSTDLGDAKVPHHPQKPVHGYRMALLALEHVYGVKGLHADAPDFGSVTFGAGKATVAFTNAGDGLVCKGDRVLAFELAGADRKFYPAEAAIINGSNVVEVSSKDVPSPVALRYAFRNYCLVSLYNKYGQTPRSYRTDKWDDAK